MLFVNYLCLLYLMVLADSHTISKSINNDLKVDHSVFESIHDVDRPTIPRTRKDRQHKYKLYYSKDDDVVLQNVKQVKSFTVLDKTTAAVKPTAKTTTEHGKRHKSPKRRVGSFWKKLRGKNKKKENTKHVSKGIKRRISNRKKETKKIDFLTTKPGPRRTKGKKKHRTKLSLKLTEHKVSKRDASGLFSTRPYSNTPQSYKLQMGIAPQVDNMLKSKSRIKPISQHSVAVASATAGASEITDTLQQQIESLNYDLSKLKEAYGLLGNNPKNKGSETDDNAEANNPPSVKSEGNAASSESYFAGTAPIDGMLSAMKAKAVQMMSFQVTHVTEMVRSSAIETAIKPSQIDTGTSAPVTGLTTMITTNDVVGEQKRKFAKTNSNELNPEDSAISSHTETHSLKSRSIKEDAMTIAMNVEELLQKELKSLYNKVKHKVSNDFHKEVHTVKSTVKDSYEKLTSKLNSKCKTCNATSSSPKTTQPAHTCPCKPVPPKANVKPNSYSATSRPAASTSAPRVRKEDEEEKDSEEDSATTELTYSKQTYDDYLMLNMYEQGLAKTHEDHIKKMIATPEFPTYGKNKREALRLSKRNPETLTDVKLSEVVRNIYDDGGNMPDYDYIDPAANVSSTRMTTASNSYNDVDYVIGDSPSPSDYNDQISVGAPMQNKPKLTSPMPKDNNADAATAVADTDNTIAEAVNKVAEVDNIVKDDNSATVSQNPATNTGNKVSDTSYEGLSNKISYNEYVNGYKHYLKFQQDLKNQNFSNLVKYQAHRHHSVDDIGKYILNKIPQLPTLKRKKRDLKFSDDSDNNMDYQEITTKSDDSWFRKHFYLFIDNGPPKKYHTSETVELKPATPDLKLFMTDKSSTPRYKEKVFIKIDTNSAPRQVKDTQEISLDDLSKILESIKDKGAMIPKEKPEIQKEDPMDVPMDTTYNATDDVNLKDTRFGDVLDVKRRHVSNRRPGTTIYYPTTGFTFAESTRPRMRRSLSKEDEVESTMIADFMNKDTVVVKAKTATTTTKVVTTEAGRTSNRETKKYGYVDIDLVPRQTAVVKLRDKTKKSRFKNFFKKFHFKKDKTKKPKPKRSVYNYDYYLPNPRIERFNPIKKLKNMFKKEKEGKEGPAAPFKSTDYDMANPQMAANPQMDPQVANPPIDSGSNLKPKCQNPLSIAELQKQIPNITDTYMDPIAEEKKHTTKQKSANFYKLDEKDQDLLYNYHPSTPLPKPAVTKGKAKHVTKKLHPVKVTEALELAIPTITTTPADKNQLSTILRVPPCNVMTVNVKTMEITTPTPTFLITETSSVLAIDDMSAILDKMQKELRKSKDFPKITTMYDMQRMKYDFKKNAQPLLREPEQLLVSSKLTRIGKFPIRKRRYKVKKGDDSENEDVDRDTPGFDGPAVLQYIHDLGNRNALPADKRKVVEKTFRKLHHPQLSRHGHKNRSMYTDYFNDLLMWHNDILNLDSVPNPLWENILRTLQTDAGSNYTTPDMQNLMLELNEMNDFLGDRPNQSAVTQFPNGSMEVKAKDRMGTRALNEINLDDGQGVIRSVAMDDNTIVTSKDLVIKGEAQYFQYSKPKSPETLGSSDFIMKLNKLNSNDGDGVSNKVKIKRKGLSDARLTSDPDADNVEDELIMVDTTLMAYDDDVESITKALEGKKMYRNPQKSSKPALKDNDHVPILKTNKAPMQYYTTPLPMKSNDFHKFLNEHDMGVDFVTAPMLDLPTLIDSWSTQKKNNKWSKQSGIVIAATAETATIPENWDTPSTMSSKETGKTDKAKSKSSETTIGSDLTSKIESITKAVSKPVKLTTDSKASSKNANHTNSISKKPESLSYEDNWGDELFRFKRFSSPRFATKPTPEGKYYSIFKKKVKNRLFEKKAPGKVERPTTTVSLAPQNKEVEITIINFDDIDKMTTRQPFDTFLVPKKDEATTFTEVIDTVTTEATVKAKSTIQKIEDLHNGLLYKDIFEERTTGTPIREYSNTDLTKSTEYIDPLPVRDSPTITSTKVRLPFEKVPVYPNIFNKLPHVKNFNNLPSRVHITSHHYKYDIFYDDIKKTGRTRYTTLSSDKYSRKRFPTSEEGSKVAPVKIIDITHRSRHRRRVPRVKRKYFTFHGSKSKTYGGISEPMGYFDTRTISSSPENPADGFSISKLEEHEPFTAAMDNTVTGSWIRKSEPLADIEDVVTMLDQQGMGVTMSDIEDTVTLSALQSEFFTSITIRDAVRRALAKKTTVSPKSTVASKTTVSPKSTVASKTTVAAETTVVTTRPSTKSATVVPSPPPGSLVYDLKQLKPTSSNKSSKDKVEQPTAPQKDRHRRLFKFSLLQNRLKNFMKNLSMTTTTKRANATTASVTMTTPTTTRKCKTKRTCVTFKPDPQTPPPEEVSDEREGFCITQRCEEDDQPIWASHFSIGTPPPVLPALPPPPRTHAPHPAPLAPAHHCEPEPDYHEQVQHVSCPSCPPKATATTRHHSPHHHANGKVACHHKKPLPQEPLEVFYVEPETYDDQLYYEESAIKLPPPIPPPCDYEDEEPTTHCEFKREVQPNYFTAKDVAALEVIVDLMKNTLNYEESNIASGLHHSVLQPSATRPLNPNGSTNAIQVHIAIPYDFQGGKKRSPGINGPIRVRKVFSAKMSTPVDLVYQVHSIEGTLASPYSQMGTSKFPTSDGLTPGMYLLIDKPRDGFALKPLADHVGLSQLKPRQLLSGTTASMMEPKPTDSRDETTSLKSLAKVTLSKDFVAAINQQLLEMYENRSRVNKDVYSNNTRMARSVWRSRSLKEMKRKRRRKKEVEKYIVKRRIDWEAVKKYFGHDRVCNCKCKSNTAMCRACAASDAVIDELIFEFDNIGRYMADHCTEIQTFFWMNPIGGQKLRDTVNKIDRSLSDYYKRVKGKCNGRTCKTFSTYIDKRTLIKTAKMKKVDDVSRLIADLAYLADDLNRTVSLNVCYNDKLKENGERFMNLMNKCIMYKSFHKRSNPTSLPQSNPTSLPQKMVRQVYSLDNINVNIICNPESTSTPEEQMITATDMPLVSPRLSDHITFHPDFHLDETQEETQVTEEIEEIQETQTEKRKGLNRLFPRKKKKSKLLSYFDFNKKSKTHFKRQVDNQVEKPLISDGGGSFWYDYLKAGTDESRLARGSVKDTPTITVDVVQREVTPGNVLKLTAVAGTNDVGLNTIYMSVQTSPERNPREAESTTDSLSRNINQMLQLFGNLQDIEAMSNSSVSSETTNFERDAAIKKADQEDKPKKLSFAYKVKQKVDKALSKNKTTANTTKKATPKKTTPRKTTPKKTTPKHTSPKHTTAKQAPSSKKQTPKIKSPLEQDLDELTTIEHTIESVAMTTLAATTSSVSDETNENMVVISSRKMSNVTTTCTPTTNKSSVTVGLATKSEESTSTTSTTEALKDTSPKDAKRPESTPVEKETTKFGFKDMIKAATVIFRKEQALQSLRVTTEEPISSTTELSTDFTPILSSMIDLVTEHEEPDYVIEENQQNATHNPTQNPTILIINDYGSQVTNYSMNDEMKEGYKNLLLSIIQFETNNLNDEWDRIAYGVPRHRDDNDVKRSIPKTHKPKLETKPPTKLTTTARTPKSTTAATKTVATTVTTTTEETYLESDFFKTSKVPGGLLNKIASKMGIRVLSPRKKVVKKPKIREVRKDRKGANIIKNRKLRINTIRQETVAPVVVTKEACHSRRTTKPAQICDIQATFDHIQTLQKSVSSQKFETLMKNVSCHKYRDVDAYFVIPYKKTGRNWDWIRSKRSLKHFRNRIKGDFDVDDKTYVVEFGDDPDDLFETFVKGEHGIYKIVKRKKRKANLDSLERGLRNIPTLMATDDELYVKVGDSVTLDCGINTPVTTCDGQFHWQTDRKKMLTQDNVEVDGVTVTIREVEPRNSGTYTCSLDHTVRKNVKLNVLTVPSFDVVFLPVYKTEDNCSYDELVAIQQLGSLMSNESRCGKACSVRIDEPACQKDRATNDTLVRATAVISMTPRDVNCSLQCKRDILSSLVMLCASNSAILSSIRVLVTKDAGNENLIPWKTLIRPVVTHTLRKKDTNGHREYRQLSSLMSPGKVDVVLICPAGYYLLPTYKLCSSCPPNTSSKTGDNTCRSCPRGTRAEPGASKCHLVETHQRRYDWWWYPPCGYVVACCSVLFGCTACVLLSVIVHVVSRDAELRERDGDDGEQKIPKPMRSVTVAYAHFPGARPLSPSRVILPRFFRPSLTSSRATDSQETKFELWKERNRPPPLPPIDFDP